MTKVKRIVKKGLGFRFEVDVMEPPPFQDVGVRPELSQYVRRMIVTETNSDIPRAAMIAPTGYAYVGWVFRGTMKTSVDECPHTTFEAPAVFVGGTLDDEWVRVNYSASYGQVLAEFTATGLYELLHIHGSAVAGIACPVEELGLGEFAFLKSAARETQIGEGISEKLADAFQKALLTFIPQAIQASKHVSGAVKLFEAANGLIKISDVVNIIGARPHGLRREFQKVVGLRPKRFARALMLNHAMENLVKGNFGSLTELSHRAGYYDQAHFIHAVRKMVRKNPRSFVTSRGSFPAELFVRKP